MATRSYREPGDKWVAYCPECRKELADWENGNMVDAMARMHTDETGHKTFVAYRIVPGPAEEQKEPRSLLSTCLHAVADWHETHQGEMTPEDLENTLRANCRTEEEALHIAKYIATPAGRRKLAPMIIAAQRRAH